MRKIVFLVIMVLSAVVLCLSDETQRQVNFSYTSQYDQVRLVSSDGGILTDTDLSYLQGCQNVFSQWSADGKLLFCPNKLLIWEKGITTKVPVTRKYSEGWWSPNGDKIALVEFNGNFDESVWLYDLQTQREQILVRTNGGLANISWRGNNVISFSLDFGVLDQFRIILDGDTSQVLQFPEIGPNIGITNGSSIAMQRRTKPTLAELEVWLLLAQMDLHNIDYFISDVRRMGDYSLISLDVLPELFRNGSGHTPIVILCKGHTVIWHAIEAYGGEFG